MIILHQFAPSWNIPNLSPFCVKVETYLRMADLPYEVCGSMPTKAPKGKLPFIEDNGQTIADSRLVLEYLEDNYGYRLDGHLNDQQRAIATATQRMMEEHLFWAGMYSRWQHSDENWHITRRAIFADLPPAIRNLVAFFVRRSILKQIYAQGTGRLDAEEIFHLAEIDLNTLATLLGEKPYFMGDKPACVDATLFGLLINILECPIDSPMKSYTLSKKNLTDYCQRIKKEFYPELNSKKGN